jgi:glycosyltransferase involved in cell wall biosynthesis
MPRSPNTPAPPDLPLRVCAMTTGINSPSSRFRWRQYEPFLRSAGIEPHELSTRLGAIPPPGLRVRVPWLINNFWDAMRLARHANQYPLRFLQREMISTLSTAELTLKQPLVFDVDDAIFLNQRFGGVDRIARHASLVVCGNEFLANHFSRFARTTVLPTAVDTSRFVPISRGLRKRLIGWSGSSSGFEYLYAIEPALRAALDKLPDVKLRIVADKAPKFRSIPAAQLEYLPWHASSEVANIQELSVGIMPLSDSPWERGKCSFKMLTYMAVGVPVVVSAVGMNIQVMQQGQPGWMARNHDEWVDALVSLLSSETENVSMGDQGRRIVEAHYAASTVGARLASILKAECESA